MILLADAGEVQSAPSPVSPSQSRRPVRTALLSMVRNEMDIVDIWLRHALALFDDIFIADHGSDDGTHDYLSAVAAQEPRVRLLRYREASYDQHLVLECLKQVCLDTCPAQWIFILDVDEFMPFTSRQALDTVLGALEQHPVVSFRWRNAYPRLSPITSPVFDGFVARDLSTFGKVAMQRAVAGDPLYRILRGAHALRHDSKGIVSGFIAGEILHLPVRSMDQLWSKVLNGCESYRAVAGYEGGEGGHWFELLNALASTPADWTLARALVHDYGQPRTPELMRTAEFAFEARICDLLLAGTASPREEAPQHGGGKVLSGMRPREKSAGHALEELKGNTILAYPYGSESRANSSNEAEQYRQRSLRLSNLKKWMSAKSMNIENLSISDGDIKHRSNWASRAFDGLVSLPPGPITVANLADALQAACLDIRFSAPSSWGEHIPFLFFLMSLVKPRRYVELGVYKGSSFFAACQVSSWNDMQCECVAIDTWQGDPHAGEYDTGVFHDFRNYLQAHHADGAGYLQMSFDKALPQFADGSIDLLHIDGFHTANAVRHDFEQWLGKMSDRGVILFHDVNEFRMDFGVWRFWRLVREKYPHMEFGHGHGLGVLIVGKNSPLKEPVAGGAFSLTSDTAKELQQILFGNLGRLSWSFKLGAETRACERQASAAEQAGLIGEADAQRTAWAHELQGRDRHIADLERRLRKYDRSLYGRFRNGIRKLKAGLKRR